MKVEFSNDRKHKKEVDAKTEASNSAGQALNALSAAISGMSDNQAVKADATPLAGLLQDVLVHVANSFPPEDTVSLCSTLANSLAGMLTKKMTPPATSGSEPPQATDPQTMYALQQALLRQQIQNDLLNLTPPATPPATTPQIQQSMPYVPSEMPLYITPAMLDTAHSIATNAAQQAAAAWRQQQASVEALAWEQEMLLRQAHGFNASMMRNPVGPMTPIPTVPPAPDPAVLASFMAPNVPLAALNLPSYLPTDTTGYGVPDAVGYTFPNHLGSGVPSLSGIESHAEMLGTPQSASNSNLSTKSGKGGGRNKNQAVETKGASKGKGKSKGQDVQASKQRTGKGGNNAKKAPQVAVVPAGGQNEGFDKSLRYNLEALHSMDSNCIVLTRKINRLGFESAPVLEAFFARYGHVNRVLVSHCHAKSRNLRFRPSGLGFVVMSCEEEALAILADGPEIEVCPGAIINVQAFKPLTELEAEEAQE